MRSVCMLACFGGSSDPEPSGLAARVAAIELVDKDKDDITVDHVMNVTFLSLLREWARKARATYERMWRVHIGA